MLLKSMERVDLVNYCCVKAKTDCNYEFINTVLCSIFSLFFSNFRKVIAENLIQ